MFAPLLMPYTQPNHRGNLLWELHEAEEGVEAGRVSRSVPRSEVLNYVYVENA
jgi:hypothetical protein